MRGHVYKRSKDSWTIVFDIGADPVTGKRRQRSRAVRGTKKDAERELSKEAVKLAEGRYFESSRITFGKFLDQWLTDYVASSVQATTEVRYRSIVERHLKPKLGSVPLSQLRPSHLTKVYGEWLHDGRYDGKGLSAQTVMHHHRVVSEALGHAVKWQFVQTNVALSVDPPKVRRTEMKTLDRDNVAKLLRSPDPSRILPIVSFAVKTGMRQGEILALRWPDLDFERRVAEVRRTVRHLPRQGFVFSEPKSRMGRRSVSLPASLVEELRSLKASQAEGKLLLGSDYQDAGLVFCRSTGLPRYATTLKRQFGRLLASSGVPGVRFHDLRHSHATLMLQQGIHPKVVSERLGHASIQITLDTYSHVLPGLQDAAAERLDEWLSGGEVDARTG